MNEAYAVGVMAKLEDQVSPALLRIIDLTEKASAKFIEFTAALRGMSGSSASLSRSLDKAVLSANKLGEGPGLAAANARLDTMAAATADIARNMEAARLAGSGMGGPVGRYPNGNGPGAGGGGSGGKTTKAGSQALAATGLAVLGGVYENAELDDTNVKAIATSQIPIEQWERTMKQLRAKEFEYASKYAFATGGKIEPFGEAILNSSRLLRTMPQGKQEQMLDTAMPYAAIESKLKNVPLPEALESFIGLAHQAGAYSEKEAKPLFSSMVQASLTTHASLGEIARAASYALPALHAAGANSADVMLMIATMQQAGIMNTKSGTWINAMAMNALPNTLGSGLFKNENQNKALHELGLYKGNQAQFYRNGEFDLMKEVAILAEARGKMGALKFNAASHLAFGLQGQRAASIFSEQTTLDNLHSLQALKNQEQDPDKVEKWMQQMSTVAKADQTIANANMTLMNASATFSGPVNWLLDKSSGAFEKTAKATEENPALGIAGIAGAGFSAMVIGKLVWKAVGGAANGLVGVISRGLATASTFVMESVTGALAGGGLLALMGNTALVGLAGAIDYGIGYILNMAVEWAIKKVTGKEGSIGTMLYDANRWITGQDRDDPNAVSKRAFDQWKKDHPLQNGVPSPNGQASGVPGQDGANRQKPPVVKVDVHNYLDGKDLLSRFLPNVSMSTGDVNPSAAPLRPGMGNYGMGQ